ncbi:MAG: DUF3106 domain-containing protein [Opitutaceae bacterium]
MNRYLKLTSLALFCISFCLSNTWAEGKSSEADGKHSGQETRLLQHLLEMNNEELSNLRLTIERIEKMTPEEKNVLRGRIGKMRKMDPRRVDEMREKYQSIPEETRKAMRERWTSMSREEREAWRDKLAEMTPEEREAIFEKEGFMPMHRKKDKGDKKKDRDGDKKNKGDKRKESPHGGSDDPPPPLPEVGSE